MKIEIKKQLGDSLKTARKEAGVTKYRLSLLGKMQRRQIDAIESGTSNYTIESLISYLSAFELSIKVETKEGSVIFNSNNSE